MPESVAQLAEFIPLLQRLELFSTLMLAGLIWTIQIVHYPLLARVGADVFIAYEREHCTRITWVVAPLMFLELTSNLALAYLSGWDPNVCGRLGLVFIIWFSTAFIQVPLHRRLGAGYDASAIRSLVRTNWIRTAAWSARATILVFGV
jgi:hypothetical protein